MAIRNCGSLRKFRNISFILKLVFVLIVFVFGRLRVIFRIDLLRVRCNDLFIFFFYFCFFRDDNIFVKNVYCFRV